MSQTLTTSPPPSATMPAPARPEQTILDAALEATCAKLDAMARSYSLESLEHTQAFRRSMIIRRGLSEIEDALTDEIMQREVMPLMGKRIGFLTDRDSKGAGQKYSLAEVRSVMVEAIFRGAFWTGNEINIIAGQLYLTKEYFERRILEHPDVANFKRAFSVPKTTPAGTVVSCRASWKQRVGEAIADESLEEEIAIRVNERMGSDAIIGKATRKLLARCLKQITGSKQVLPEGEIEDTGPVGGPNGSTPAPGRVSLRAANGEGAAAVVTPAPAAPASGLTEEQCEGLAAHIRNAGVSWEDFSNHFLITRLAKLPASRLVEAETWLKARAEDAAAAALRATAERVPGEEG